MPVTAAAGLARSRFLLIDPDSEEGNAGSGKRDPGCARDVLKIESMNSPQAASAAWGQITEYNSPIKCCLKRKFQIPPQRHPGTPHRLFPTRGFANFNSLCDKGDVILSEAQRSRRIFAFAATLAVKLVRRSFDYTPLRSVPLRMTHYLNAVQKPANFNLSNRNILSPIENLISAGTPRRPFCERVGFMRPWLGV